VYTDIYIIQIAMRDEKESCGRGGRYVSTISRALISSSRLGGGACKAPRINCRIESLGPKVHNTNPYSSRKTYQSEKEKDKKKVWKKTAKNMVNVAAYFETSFKHVTITHDNPTRGEHEYTLTHKYDATPHIILYILL